MTLSKLSRRCLSTSVAYHRNAMKLNVGVCFVPTQESFVIERFGKYHKILDSGLNLIIPFIDQVAYIQLLKEQAIQIDSQSAITSDNVVLQINGVLYIKVIDPYKASYGVDDPEEAITQLAKTTMRANIGSMTLDTVFRERDALNAKIVESLNSASHTCTKPAGSAGYLR